jgi:hypothetical protein
MAAQQQGKKAACLGSSALTPWGAWELSVDPWGSKGNSKRVKHTFYERSQGPLTPSKTLTDYLPGKPLLSAPHPWPPALQTQPGRLGLWSGLGETGGRGGTRWHMPICCPVFGLSYVCVRDKPTGRQMSGQRKGGQRE